MGKLPEKELRNLYLVENLSAAQIARLFDCSLHKVDYWLKQHLIPKRSISEAVYVKRNPTGDPFSVRSPRTLDDAFLRGLGLGLYWGEGTKSNKSSIRLGNTDVRLIKKFMEFLVRMYGVKKDRFKFGLQVFNDVSPASARKYWCRELGISPHKLQKVVVSRVRGRGSYNNKSEHGVLTVYFNNKKLRDVICADVERLRQA